MANKSKSGGNGGALFRPWLCVMGVMFLWASQNQPPALSSASVAIWVLSSIAVGLIAGAACAFVQPLIAAVAQASRDMAKARASSALGNQLQAAEARAAAPRAAEPRAAEPQAAGPRARADQP
jgi:hypothetical protein